jgi:arylsulfatase A-like enzyme
LAAHIDLLPTLMDIAGIKASPKLTRQLEGRSLLPLLQDPLAPWPERTLVTHVGRWPQGKAADSKYAHCSIRNTRWQLVSDTAEPQPHWQLFDLRADPGETNDVSAQNPQVCKELETAYDRWWASVTPCLENESATGPNENPFKGLFWKQFGKPTRQ